jgi:glycosyltransferase involved in cell wall biosynthesis
VSRGRTLILVENLSVPFDRRVWQESLSLRRAGFDVVVVCPRGRDRDEEPLEVREGITIHRYPLVAAAAGPLGYLREYAAAFWHTFRLTRKLAREQAFDVVHACNPPDFLLVAALPLKRGGTRFIFDHHDLVPELYLSRFRDRRDVLFRFACLLERITFALADVVIATNESYRIVALTRGRRRPEDVFVVRSAPDLARFRASEPDERLKHGKRYLIVYLGVMGPQDGVDHALRALANLGRQRQDWHAVFVGDGDARPAMMRLSDELGLAADVEFTGRIPDEELLRILGTADVCLAPDPKNPLNDLSTMNKIVEYMAMSRPIVSYDLVEARISAADAAVYAEPNDTGSFATAIAELLDQPQRRARMGAVGRTRVERDLSWQQSEHALLAAYERALGRASDGSAVSPR